MESIFKYKPVYHDDIKNIVFVNKASNDKNQYPISLKKTIKLINKKVPDQIEPLINPETKQSIKFLSNHSKASENQIIHKLKEAKPNIRNYNHSQSVPKNNIKRKENMNEPSVNNENLFTFGREEIEPKKLRSSLIMQHKKQSFFNGYSQRSSLGDFVTHSKIKRDSVIAKISRKENPSVKNTKVKPDIIESQSPSESRRYIKDPKTIKPLLSSQEIESLSSFTNGKLKKMLLLKQTNEVNLGPESVKIHDKKPNKSRASSICTKAKDSKIPSPVNRNKVKHHSVISLNEDKSPCENVGPALTQKLQKSKKFLQLIKATRHGSKFNSNAEKKRIWKGGNGSFPQKRLQDWYNHMKEQFQ